MIANVGSTSAASASAATASAPAAIAAASEAMLGKDAFLSLLVTQLQNQDPMQPQDNGEFIAQLAQFSSLEQLQQMNKTLDTIASFFSQMEAAANAAAATPGQTP